MEVGMRLQRIVEPLDSAAKTPVPTQDPAELKKLLEAGDDTSFTRFLFQKPSFNQRIAVIPHYHKQPDGNITMRFEPLMVLDYVHDSSAGAPAAAVYPPKDKARFSEAADMLQNKWRYFSGMKNATSQNRPRVLAVGREGVANGIKIIAIANEASKNAGTGEFCVVPSYQVVKGQGRDGSDLVQTKFELFAA